LLNIKPNASDKEKRFAIVKAQIVQPLHVSEDQTRVGKLREDYRKVLEAMNNQNANINLTIGGGGGGGGAVYPGGGTEDRPVGLPGLVNPGAAAAPAATGAPEDTMAFQDRATGESVLDDWEITVVALVQVDPPPPALPAQPGQQANAQQP